MIKLEIKKPNGEIYWTEHFSNLESANKWLDEEKTRKYWNDDFTHEFIDLTPPPKTPDEIAKEAVEQVERDEAKLFLKQLKKSDLVDLDTCASAIMKIVKHLRADK